MRDIRKPQSHFLEMLDGELYAEELKLDKLESNDTSESSKDTARLTLFLTMKEIVFCQYSMGRPIEEIRQTMERIMQHHKKGYFNLEWSYVESVNFLSIAYCLGLEQSNWADYLSKLKMAKPSGLCDRLMSRIASEMGIDIEIPSKVYFENPYSQLVKALDAEESQQVDIIKEYLTRHWYKGHSSSGWHGTHKSKLVYSGYWSFESAAVVKILGLDPEEFNGIDYFPGDILKSAGPIV